MTKDEHEWLEKKYGELSRKEQREERKRARNVDRSKYKKSDQRQQAKQRSQIDVDRDGLVSGRVLSIFSEELTVQAEGELHTCVLRGVLKKERTRDKNLVAVGDLVLFEPTAPGEGAISHVEERKSVLSRAETLDHKRQQVLVANVDQVLITTSVQIPPLKPTLIDRYIISCRKGKMDPVIVVNKCDLLGEHPAELELLELMEEAYSAVGIPLLRVSAQTSEGFEELQKVMQGKVSCFSGQSGVGKSSLINAVTGLDLAVAPPVEATRKGTHTTTRANLIPLDFGGWCVDTPGIKSFGVWDLTPDQVKDYFPDLEGKCRFPDCTHRHEPGCEVREKVEQGEISQLRFDSYCQLVEDLSTQHRRR